MSKSLPSDTGNLIVAIFYDYYVPTTVNCCFQKSLFKNSTENQRQNLIYSIGSERSQFQTETNTQFSRMETDLGIPGNRFSSVLYNKRPPTRKLNC